ncbi:MAG: GntR family transcriptional regulator [Clostridiales bacterium]|nr:GntR family transcriptional regulator [Clostridiales bacterium]
MDKSTDILPQYMRIAADLAAKIVASEYGIDHKIPGKSTLSSAYGVSQETVRKAENLLSDMGVLG